MIYTMCECGEKNYYIIYIFTYIAYFIKYKYTYNINILNIIL
jgi:hypothetical protein